jgi:hypothetical protein
LNADFFSCVDVFLQTRTTAKEKATKVCPIVALIILSTIFLELVAIEANDFSAVLNNRQTRSGANQKKNIQNRIAMIEANLASDTLT